MKNNGNLGKISSPT